MKFFERRRMRKVVRHLLHEARHARNMREDVTPPDQLQSLVSAEHGLRQAWREADPEKIDAAAEQVVAGVNRIHPPRGFAKVRENVEIIAVAVAVAMAFRTYFIQPFKIPTGSMQPTLYGVTVQAQNAKRWYDQFPLNLAGLALFGERYVEVRAQAGGVVDYRYLETEDAYRFFVGGRPHAVPKQMTRLFQPGETVVAKGQALARGRVRMGDHIFVNKIRYNFSRPARGDIFVFSTTGIADARIRPDSFYIKRLAGLPGERISLDPPYLVADGRRITDPYPFKRLVEETDKGYVGYQLPLHDPSGKTVLGSRGQEYALTPSQYLPLGDNTRFSLDGRYFGGVERANVVGPAFAVYWPFGARWGLVR